LGRRRHARDRVHRQRAVCRRELCCEGHGPRPAPRVAPPQVSAGPLRPVHALVHALTWIDGHLRLVGVLAGDGQHVGRVRVYADVFRPSRPSAAASHRAGRSAGAYQRRMSVPRAIHATGVLTYHHDGLPASRSYSSRPAAQRLRRHLHGTRRQHRRRGAPQSNPRLSLHVRVGHTFPRADAAFQVAATSACERKGTAHGRAGERVRVGLGWLTVAAVGHGRTAGKRRACRAGGEGPWQMAPRRLHIFAKRRRIMGHHPVVSEALAHVRIRIQGWAARGDSAEHATY